MEGERQHSGEGLECVYRPVEASREPEVGPGITQRAGRR